MKCVLHNDEYDDNEDDDDDDNDDDDDKGRASHVNIR